MLIDTHAHVNFKAYKNDADKVIRRSLENEIWMINVGSQYSTSKAAVEIAEKYKEGVYAAVGLHPIHAQDERFDYEKYKKLALRSLGEGRVVAIGEIGLDYKEEYAFFKEKQKEVFLKQLELAKELKLPVIFHCRQAHNDFLEILRLEIGNWKLEINGVVHCFTGKWQEAEKYLKMGLYLGFNGIIFKLNLNKVIEKTPLDKILVETDCPYLAPLPKQGRNEPLFVKYVAEKIAKIKKIPFEKVCRATTKNAKELFRLPV